MHILSSLQSFFLFSGFFLWGISCYSQDPNFHIYLCFGQSNMSGQGPYTDADKTVDARFQVLRAADHSNQQVGEFYPAAPPLGHSKSQMGPADFFGRKMIQLVPENVTVAVANIAIGGQSIDLFDKETSAGYIANARSINDWWIQYLDEYGGDVYKRIIEMGQIAKQKGVIKGILFHQGEADYDNPQWGAKVKKVYEDVLSDLGLSADDVPILIGELVRTEEGGALGWRNDAVAQTAELIPTGHLISSEGCPMLTTDGLDLHFTREGYQILGERYAMKMFELLKPAGAPDIIITSPLSSDILFENQTIEISASVTDTDGTVEKVEFFNGSEKLGETIQEPYTFNWENVPAGTYTIKVAATDNEQNQSSSSVVVTVHEPQTAYGGTPHPVPGLIELEEFDNGGQGIAYFDSSPGSSVDPAPDYRTDEDVDVEVCEGAGGGYNLGWTIAGEWTEYTVNVKESGTYKIDFRLACNGDGRTVSLDADGLGLVSDLAVPNTGGWQTWQTVSIENVKLTAGEQVLRLTIGNEDYVNLNNITFMAQSTETDTVVFPLSAGWNLIGYPYLASSEVETVFESILTDLEIVKDFIGFWDASNTATNTLSKLEYGKGYFVKVAKACQLKWTVE